MDGWLWQVLTRQKNGLLASHDEEVKFFQRAEQLMVSAELMS